MIWFWISKDGQKEWKIYYILNMFPYYNIMILRIKELKNRVKSPYFEWWTHVLCELVRTGPMSDSRIVPCSTFKKVELYPISYHQ